MTKKSISYVFPIYNESGNIERLYGTLSKLLRPLEDKGRYSFEIILVNDGSKDDSLEILKQLAMTDKRLVVINFARNYGHQIAVTAGLDYARGEAVIIMDSDMQDPPSVSIEMIEKWEEGYDVVYAQRISRKDTLFKRLTAKVFYKTLRTFADIDIPENTGDFRLLDRRVVQELKKFKEHDRFLRGMVSFIGFKQVALPFHRDERYAGVTGYPLKKMIKFAVDGITGFSTVPLQFVGRVGFVIALLSVLGIVYALLMKIFAPQVTIEGWTFIVISILFIGGVQLLMLGVIGAYIGRIYTEVKDRPLYAIESVITKGGK